MATTTQTRGSIKNIICPDGSRRTFQVNGIITNGNHRGYVQVRGVSVAGYAKPRGRGFKFFPYFDSKNIALVRPATLAVNTRVRITDGDYAGKTGRVCGVIWNYLTPTYSVRLSDGRFKSPVSVTGTGSVTQITG